MGTHNPHPSAASDEKDPYRYIGGRHCQTRCRLKWIGIQRMVAITIISGLASLKSECLMIDVCEWRIMKKLWRMMKNYEEWWRMMKNDEEMMNIMMRGESMPGRGECMKAISSTSTTELSRIIRFPLHIFRVMPWISSHLIWTYFIKTSSKTVHRSVPLFSRCFRIVILVFWWIWCDQAMDIHQIINISW